jgi:hypothetical protein
MFINIHEVTSTIRRLRETVQVRPSLLKNCSEKDLEILQGYITAELYDRDFVITYNEAEES